MIESEDKTSTGLKQNLAGLLCYVLGWVTGIVFLIIEKDSQFVRFHAFQSIITFGAITIVQIILSFIPVVGWIFGYLVWALTLILWIILMVNAYQGKKYKLPIAGDIAERLSKPSVK
jgi:uncharacterized membrane protein